MSTPAPVYLVEDDPDIALLVRLQLEEDLGLAVRCFGDGAEALAAMREAAPSLAILDLSLPGLDGLEVCRRVRADGALRRVPLLLLTARAGDAAHAAGREAGADAYLVKPFRAEELESQVRSLLAR